MTILVVIGGTTVVDLTLSGTHPVSTIISINPGSITSSDGATTLQVSGSVDDASAGDSLTDAYWMALGMDNLTPTLGAGFHEWENLATGRKEYWIIVAVNLQVDALDNITSGTARYTEGFETFTVACISGTLDDPVVTANAGACTVAETVPGAYPLGDLDDIKLTFQAFRSMHGAVKGLVKAALALVAVPAQ